MRKLIKISLLVAAVGVTYPLMDLAYAAFKSEQALVHNEHKCVAELIAQGVQRIDIATGNGTCWDEENGYYN